MTPSQRWWVFYHVARCGSFTAASAELYVSQPGLSAAIKALERDLGCPLFVRHARGVTLTREGAVLFRHVEQAYQALAAGDRRVREWARLEAGVVRIGAGEPLSRLYLLPNVLRFRQAHPGVQFQVVHGTSGPMAALVAGGHLDGGLVHLPITESGLTVVRGPCMEEVFVVGAAWRQLAGRVQPVAELVRHPLITLDDSASSRRRINEWLAAQGLEWPPSSEVGSLDLVLEFTRAGLGIGILPRAAAASALASEVIWEIPSAPALPAPETALVRPKAPPSSLAARRFLDGWTWKDAPEDRL